ncbi:MAG: hypothetical protein ACOC6P_01340 [Candidatus Aminicenantaceae bacterium]
MKLINREQVENLSKFQGKTFLTTSYFLDTDKSRLTKKEIILSGKNLIRNGHTKLKDLNLSKEKEESALMDLDKISDFCSPNQASFESQGLAIFSCSEENFWQVFELPDAPRNLVIFDGNPYVRPLSAILNEYNRICTLLLDRKEAKWYQIYMKEITPIKEISGDVPSQVKEGGWEGYESKRIERHIAAHLHDFFKKVAKETFELFKQKNFNWLFLGCDDKYFPVFEPLLHPYIKERLKGRIKALPGISKSKILQESLEKEKSLKEEEEQTIVNSFISELNKGGLATSGIKNTLRSLNRGEVQTLIVRRHFSKPGTICPKCKFLFLDEKECPSCKVETGNLNDVIDEAVEKALDNNSDVKHINSQSNLRRYGNIGALLRYKT